MPIYLFSRLERIVAAVTIVAALRSHVLHHCHLHWVICANYAISLTVIECLAAFICMRCLAAAALIIHNINRLQSVCSSINKTKTSHKRTDHDSSLLTQTGDVSSWVHSICIVSRAAVVIAGECVALAAAAAVQFPHLQFAFVTNCMNCERLLAHGIVTPQHKSKRKTKLPYQQYCRSAMWSLAMKNDANQRSQNQNKTSKMSLQTVTRLHIIHPASNRAAAAALNFTRFIFSLSIWKRTSTYIHRAEIVLNKFQ